MHLGRRHVWYMDRGVIGELALADVRKGVPQTVEEHQMQVCHSLYTGIKCGAGQPHLLTLRQAPSICCRVWTPIRYSSTRLTCILH